MNTDVTRRIRLAAGDSVPIHELQELALPPRICGVYFLISGNEIVYVGQSADVVRRVNEHFDRGRKKFDSVMYLPCSLGEVDEIEEHFIKALTPRYNHIPQRMGTAAYVRHILQTKGPLPLDEIVKLAPEHGVWAQCPNSLRTNITRALYRDPLVRRCSVGGRLGPIHRLLEGAEVQ